MALKYTKRPSTPHTKPKDKIYYLGEKQRLTLISALRTALSNFSGADDSEIREALTTLGAKP